MREARAREVESVQLRTAKVDSLQLRPGTIDDHRASLEYSEGSTDIIGEATVEAIPIRLHVRFGAVGRPRRVAAYEAGEQCVNMSAIARVKVAQVLQGINSAEPDRGHITGQLIDRFDEQVDGLSLAIDPELTQGHRCPEEHPDKGKQSPKSLKQCGTYVVLGSQPLRLRQRRSGEIVAIHDPRRTEDDTNSQRAA
ncbi:hypothetical protein FRACA_810019 [Frankia canadensis]|uniref:Uncharacterized protein n=1 Tax=Frankia canadensis TaxID=1836972 RepID=A0A2I2L1P3_9ACTN|nr:hypothetical protein FRACA_810019 [Frankia canadensis]SOU59118.1 hypothetical protein FRACA_810019 [Frankia canadensis]